MNYITRLCPVIMLMVSSPALLGQSVVHERFEKAVVGTISGRVTFANDVVGWGGLLEPNRRSAFFDGRAETYVDHGRAKKVTEEDFTVEAFVKLAERSGYAAIAADWNEENDHRSWAFVLTPRGALRFDVSPDGKFHPGNKLETSRRLIEPGRWYHVAAVSRGTDSRIFVNGRQVAAGTRTTPGLFTEDSANLKIGNVDRYATRGPRPWRGWLDEVRITNKSLAPDGFIRTRSEMPKASGPEPGQYVMPFAATDRTDATAWQQKARKRLLQLVERQQPRRSIAQAPLDFQLGEPKQQDGYKLYPASFQGNDGSARIECRFAVPDGKGPFPAMLALHGHSGSCDVVFDRTSIYHGMADQFARGGYVVIAPSFPHREYCATMLWDLMRLVDILESRDEVDSDRIGVAGLSMGGEWTMWSAACDLRIKAAVVSGWMCTTEGVFSVPNCECWELPGFVELMDVCEVHLMVAPRPLLFESAESDSCFPLQFTKQGFARIQAGYRVFGAEENVRQDTWPAGHEWHGVKAYPFIDNALGGHASQLQRGRDR